MNRSNGFLSSYLPTLAAGVLSFAVVNSSWAESNIEDSEFSFQQIKEKTTVTLLIDMQFGGDELGYISYEDGSKDSVHAGSGLAFGGGFSYSIDERISAETRLSYLFDSVTGKTPSGSSLSVDFTRFPLDFAGFYRHGKHSIGAGLTYHMSPTLSLGSESIDFDSTFGTLFEYRYFYNKNSSVNFKMVNIDYEYQNLSFNGSSFGIGASAFF
jgi:hypothetical protein